MKIEKVVMKTEVIFSEDKEHRYLLRKEWDNKKSKATIIMTNPSTANLLTMDYTTLYIINNLVKLNFGSVEIVNMISKPTTKLNTKEDINSTNENIEQIVKSAERADSVIIAWGKIGENNKKIRLVQNKLLEHIKSFEEKLYIIGSTVGESGFHPLAPQIRFTWILKKLDLPQNKENKEEAKDEEVNQDEQLHKLEQTI